MDPFVVFKQRQVEGIEPFTYKTKVKDGAGKKPVWNETFEVPVTNMDLKLEVNVLEEDTMSNDDLGIFKVTPRMFSKAGAPTQFKAFVKEKNTSVLFMTAKWIPDESN